MITTFGFIQNAHNCALFIWRSQRGIILVLLYVDDIIITEDDFVGISVLKYSLNKSFEIKDLALSDIFLAFK